MGSQSKQGWWRHDKKYEDKTTGDAGAEITQSGTSREQTAKELLSKNEGLK